jgi:hypothetical protein
MKIKLPADFDPANWNFNDLSRIRERSLEEFEAISQWFKEQRKVPHIPEILLEGYTDRIREIGANPPTFEELKEAAEKYGLSHYPDIASMVLSDDLRKRAFELDLDAIKECNQKLPGWVNTLPEVQAEIARHQKAIAQGDPTGKAEKSLLAIILPRSIGNYKKIIPQREGYALYTLRVYQAAKYLWAILDSQKDADPVELCRMIHRAVNRLLTESEKQNYRNEPFYVMYFLQDRKKNGLKNQFTTNTTILDCMRNREKFTPQRFAHIIMGLALDRSPGRIKKELSKMDFSVIEDIQKTEYFKAKAKVFCDYMLALK